MKIKKVSITQNQFKNLSLDLTYPINHPKAGKPLNKICLIGQSGTGKTTILKVLQSILSRKTKNEFTNFRVILEYENLEYIVSGTPSGINNYRPRPQANTSDIPFFQKIAEIDTAMIHMPADFLTINSNNSNFVEVLNNENIYDFGLISVNAIWDRILDRVKEHQLKMRTINDNINRINNSVLSAREKKLQTIPLYEELEILELFENNPLKNLAKDCLDIILSHFNLKVITDYNSEDNTENINFIQVADKNGNIIPNGLLSTGTKQFILSALPFYLLRPNNSIILFDEPERSLYPNIQKLLVNHYSQFAIDSQFFYATHSPIIASCFDPWEVIELKYDKDGFVYQEPYYKGERNVDNYIVHPKYLTYELILKQVFDVQNTDGDDRARKMTEFFMLEDKLKNFKKNRDSESEEFKETMANYEKIGNLILWPNKSEA